MLGTLDVQPASAQVKDLGKGLMDKASESGGAHRSPSRIDRCAPYPREFTERTLSDLKGSFCPIRPRSGALLTT